MGTLEVSVCGKEPSLRLCVSALHINLILHSGIVVYDHNTVQIHVCKPRSRKGLENVTNHLPMSVDAHA